MVIFSVLWNAVPVSDGHLFWLIKCYLLCDDLLFCLMKCSSICWSSFQAVKCCYSIWWSSFLSYETFFFYLAHNSACSAYIYSAYFTDSLWQSELVFFFCLMYGPIISSASSNLWPRPQQFLPTFSFPFIFIQAISSFFLCKGCFLSMIVTDVEFSKSFCNFFFFFATSVWLSCH